MIYDKQNFVGTNDSQLKNNFFFKLAKKYFYYNDLISFFVNNNIKFLNYK